MKLTRIALFALSGLSVAFPAPASSRPAQTQTVPQIAAGMAIVDDGGNPVGHVVSVQGNDVLVRTDRHEARIPRSSLWSSRGRLVMSMTRAQLNAAVDRLTPPPPVQIAPGVTVRGSGGAVAGTIESMSQDHVVLRLTSGEGVRIPRTSVGSNAEGAFITITAEELRRRLDSVQSATEAPDAESSARPSM